MRYITTLILFLFEGVGSGFSQPIKLNPDSIDSFVMDPATFSEKDNFKSIWELAPFGRKHPTTNRVAKRKNGKPIIEAISNQSISSV